jgi:hypothetical protein
MNAIGGGREVSAFIVESRERDSPRRNYIISILRWLVSILLSI